MLSVVDFNVPWAKAREHVAELCAGVQFVNDLLPASHAACLEFPEIPKKTSKRGICDEEQQIQEELWALRQVLDCRWICPFEIHPGAQDKTVRRFLG